MMTSNNSNFRTTRLSSNVPAVKFAIFSVVFLEIFGIRFTDTFSLSFSFISLYAFIILSYLKNYFINISYFRLLIFIIFLIMSCLFLVYDEANYISIPSLFLLIVLYIPFIVDIYNFNPEEQIELLNFFQESVFVLAIIATIQFILQFAYRPDWLFASRTFVPDFIQTAGVWNQAIPMGSKYKANGFFQLEPSGLSLLCGVALLMEFSYGRRLLYTFVITIAMFLSYSGTGMLVLIFGLLIPNNLLSLLRTALIVPLIAIVAFPLSEFLGTDYFVGRANEFFTPGTSGYARFVAPAEILERGADSILDIVLGHGPGTMRPYIARYPAMYEVHDPTWAKLIFEYGIIGFIAMIVFMCSFLSQAQLPWGVSVGLFYGWLFSGGLLLSPTYITILFTLRYIAVRRYNINDKSAK